MLWSLSPTWAIPVTDIGTPWLVYTVGLSTCSVMVFSDILQTISYSQSQYIQLYNYYCSYDTINTYKSYALLNCSDQVSLDSKLY